MAEKDAPAAKKSASPKKSAAKKAPAKKASSGKESQEHVTVDDMHKLLVVLQDGLSSRDKAMDYLVQEIMLNKEQIEQNKKILAKRGLVQKLVFALLAIGLIIVGKDQYTIVKSFDEDMTIVAKDMTVMLAEMTAMRKSIESMSIDMNAMSKGVTSIDKSVLTMSTDVGTMSRDVKSMSYGVRGMSHDTRDMNRSMDTMTPPWSPFR